MRAWEDRTARALERADATGKPPPDGFLQGWVGADYSVQRYLVPGFPGWDRLHVQRHDGEPVRSWADLQAIKCELLEDGADRLAIEVYPPSKRVVDAAHAYHLWALPAGAPLADALDFGHALGNPRAGRTYELPGLEPDPCSRTALSELRTRVAAIATHLAELQARHRRINGRHVAGELDAALAASHAREGTLELDLVDELELNDVAPPRRVAHDR